MKVWFDVLTPKQLLFLGKFAEYLKEQNVECVITSRSYGEVTELAKIHNVSDIIYCGEYGTTLQEKLKNSVLRMEKLSDIINYENPDVAINCCSPDACRVAYGVGIPLFLFNDTPWAEITNRLTMPLAKRVWTPMVYRKSLFTRYGLTDNKIKHYNCIDSFVTGQRKSVGKPPIDEKYVLFRNPETFASYYNNKFDTLSILRTLQSMVKHKILVLCRYPQQYNAMKALNDKQIIPTLMKYDGKMLYENAEFFIGAGGTLAVESALSGTPTIIYDIIKKNPVIDYLEKKNVVLRVRTISQLEHKIKHVMQYKNAYKARARDLNKTMDVPFSALYDDIRQILGLE